VPEVRRSSTRPAQQARRSFFGAAKKKTKRSSERNTRTSLQRPVQIQPKEKPMPQATQYSFFLPKQFVHKYSSSTLTFLQFQFLERHSIQFQ
jgi:hypothetical protein